MSPTTQSPSSSDYSSWVGNSKSSTDRASLSVARRLSALLNHAELPGEHTPLFALGHWLQFNPEALQQDLGADGHPKLGEFMPPLAFPRRMWAGGSIDFHHPITPGQTLTKTTTIDSITPKTGASGKLCFVALRHSIEADDTPALTEHQTLVYREAPKVDPAVDPTSQPREASEAPAGWDWSVSQQPDALTLFRYSALTFNAHRIHYDLPYATQVERYPGLVVHGPLLATFIMDAFLSAHPGAQLLSFTFQARSPSFAGEQLHVVGRAEQRTAELSDRQAEELAVIAPGGAVAVTARIEYR